VNKRTAKISTSGNGIAIVSILDGYLFEIVQYDRLFQQ